MPEVFVEAFNVVDDAGVVLEAHEYVDTIDGSDRSSESRGVALEVYYLVDGTPLSVSGNDFINVKIGKILKGK